MAFEQLIHEYLTNIDALEAAVKDLSPSELSFRPAAEQTAGAWSIQEVVLHLADCELVYCDRMKRVIAEDNPTLQGFDENKWVGALQYLDQSVDEAIQLMRLSRKQMSRVLKVLPESAFNRFGTHTERGKLTLMELVNGAIQHLNHHLKFVLKKRAVMGM
jgi:uncharacterized damage-inducible protein DinB